MNLKELKEVFRLVEKTDFNEVEISHGDLKVRIERGREKNGGIPMTHLTSNVHGTTAPVAHSVMAPAASPQVSEGKAPAAKAADTGKFVTSPFVGTFYRSPSPDSPPYAEVGQMVKKGQSLCIVEAMKLMNEIESDYDGRIAEIYVENGRAVEFGEKLFRIEAA